MTTMWKIALLWVLLMAVDLVRSRRNKMALRQTRRRDQGLTPAAHRSLSPKSPKACSNYVCHYDEEDRIYKTTCVTDLVDNLMDNPKDFRGRCEDACKNVVDDCNDKDKCTKDSTVCDVTTNFKKACVFKQVTCNTGYSCNPADGLCATDDQLVPCVAVIDEDSSFKKNSYHHHDQKQLWADFRSAYPDRPFCLLVPGHAGHMHTPPAFLNDTLVTVHYDVARDYGDASLADDWAALCGLDAYTSANVPVVGLFIDSGHKHKRMIDASRNLFYKDMKAKGMTVKEFDNNKENWMLPFMKKLA